VIGLYDRQNSSPPPQPAMHAWKNSPNKVMGLVASLLPYLFGHSDRDPEGVSHGQMLETLIVSHTAQSEVGGQGDSCIHYESVFGRF